MSVKANCGGWICGAGSRTKAMTFWHAVIAVVIVFGLIGILGIVVALAEGRHPWNEH